MPSSQVQGTNFLEMRETLGIFKFETRLNKSKYIHSTENVSQIFSNSRTRIRVSEENKLKFKCDFIFHF